MRSSLRRHLDLLDLHSTAGLDQSQSLRFFSVSETENPVATATTYEGELSPHDYVSYLLHVDAEIEHGLMVQYLYAAYSLGGPQVPPQHRDTVRNWQQTILGISKEEMGHLMSVQNVLRLIGSPLNLGRDDYPWDVGFYPFPFALEPLTLDSLAKYVYAEAPEDWSGPLADEISARVEKATPTPHKVSALFSELIRLMKDPNYLPDDLFQADTYPYQASWAEWGRGYNGGPAPASSSTAASTGGIGQGASPKATQRFTANVLVVPLASRDDAVNALSQIAEQGEATTLAEGNGPSHFERFRDIYIEMSKLAAEGWSPTRPVATNPCVGPAQETDPAQDLRAAHVAHPITDLQSQRWAQMHNLRYRMLLTYLTHSFTLAGGLEAAGTRTPRGAIINATFGEMYNLRAIADILMQLPLAGGDNIGGLNAGPPFQMPYTLDSPLGERNRWQQHIDLLQAAKRLNQGLVPAATTAQQAYLAALQEADDKMMEQAARIMANHANLALI